MLLRTCGVRIGFTGVRTGLCLQQIRYGAWDAPTQDLEDGRMSLKYYSQKLFQTESHCIEQANILYQKMKEDGHELSWYNLTSLLRIAIACKSEEMVTSLYRDGKEANVISMNQYEDFIPFFRNCKNVDMAKEVYEDLIGKGASRWGASKKLWMRGKLYAHLVIDAGYLTHSKIVVDKLSTFDIPAINDDKVQLYAKFYKRFSQTPQLQELSKKYDIPTRKPFRESNNNNIRK